MLADEGLPSLDKHISGNIYQFVDSGSVLISICISWVSLNHCLGRIGTHRNNVYYVTNNEQICSES